MHLTCEKYHPDKNKKLISSKLLAFLQQ